MRHALAFLTTALLITGCHKNTGESPTPPADIRDSGQTGSTLSATTPSSGGDKAQAGTTAPAGDRAAVESCVDRWLQAHKLDSYGNPEGTMYAGGTPLFNEATGETRDRLEYVFSRQPDARKACVEKNAQ